MEDQAQRGNIALSRSGRGPRTAAALACWPLALLTAAVAGGAGGQEATPRLVDTSADSGLAGVAWSGGPDKNHILESAGNGVVVIDHDGDGWADLYLASAQRFTDGIAEPHSGRLYRSRRDGGFSDVTRVAGTTTGHFGSGGCVGDYDGDGHVDLYLTALGPDALLRNNGDGTFTRVDVGVDADGWSTAATFFDADGDGDLDLFVAAYVQTTVGEALAARRHRLWRGRIAVLDGPRGLPGDRNRYFENRGDGTFEEATERAGLGDKASFYSFGVVALDHDGDGDTDLYVANDSQANALYDNQGDGTFLEIATSAGLGFNANGMEQGSMGVAAGDYDGDGRVDLVVTNFASDAYTLYRNLGTLFMDVSIDTGVAVPTFTPLGWGTFFFDVDLDADLDLFFANGHLYIQVDDDPTLGERYRQPNQLLVNDRGHFSEAGLGFQAAASSRGAATVDLDNDGDLDVVISNQDAPPTVLINETARGARHWVGFDLSDRGRHRAGVGARLEIEAGGRTQVRWLRAGDSYMSQSDWRAHFGIGAATTLDRVEITWADGETETVLVPDVDAYWRLSRGRLPRRLRQAS